MCEKYELAYIKHTRYNKNKETKRYLKLVCGHSFPSLSQNHIGTLMLGCVTQCSQSAAHSYEQFLQVQQIGFVTLGPLRHVLYRGGCLELYYCNMVEWSWWDSSLI